VQPAPTIVPVAPAAPVETPAPSAPAQPTPSPTAATPAASGPATVERSRARKPGRDRDRTARRRRAAAHDRAPIDPPVAARAPTFATAVVSSVEGAADRTPEALLIAAALALLGVALAGLSVVDRVRREAGMA